ncbi:hypothetical protein TEU_06020 [Thermococcus eurythermalis]|uniref:Transcription regulator TrmB C-terminal domain-containing protein n=1 Tax=Thermococcus eurythermalis TaxID=1505907 RepID=A0A097QTV5_9EURY|nr:TrmB family transcriptional regulator sugar-binding domain-containing protein [Thermococcus eurythermalis]AIU69915.1 hypothetical protein TEU_06020 [Thermococcus eurythermalis]
MRIKTNLIVVILIGLALTGIAINSYVRHYQGGEIYEAANHAYGLLVKGFNVTITAKTTDGRTVDGTLLSVRGSTIFVVINGTTYTVGGPQATKEDIRAKMIRVIYRGKVYLYEVNPLTGRGSEVFSKLIPEQYYSVRYSGKIYIDGNITPTEIGRLKYQADYMTYGSITIDHLGSNGAIITANMVPVQYLIEHLGNYTVYTYGTLNVNSEERNLPLKLLEVRSP